MSQFMDDLPPTKCYGCYGCYGLPCAGVFPSVNLSRSQMGTLNLHPFGPWNLWIPLDWMPSKHPEFFPVFFVGSYEININSA